MSSSANFSLTQSTPTVASVPVSRNDTARRFKQEVVDSLWSVVDCHDWVISATLTGSFLEKPGLTGFSDIDLVLIVDHLNAERMELLKSNFSDILTPTMQKRGLALRLNPTLGPLKFNDPATAVLHLMVYSANVHVEHVSSSPFTCLDWQRSRVNRKKSLFDIYPTFSLQPRHFLSSRRSIQDYLQDYHAAVVSFRELECCSEGYREVKRQKPMADRDRHEFAYHIVKFLMRNLCKLVRRHNEQLDGEELLNQYLALFPEEGEETRRLFRELSALKASGQFDHPVEYLNRRLELFVERFERQFCDMFVHSATRHVAFRHAATVKNHEDVSQRVFLGRDDPSIKPVDRDTLAALLSAIDDKEFHHAYVSPATRCRESYQVVAQETPLPTPSLAEQLWEIDYGECEGLTVAQARKRFPQLFDAWQRGEDPPFPEGESHEHVMERTVQFIQNAWEGDGGDSLVCTHNVVLRCMIGAALNIPKPLWHRLQVPHLEALTFVHTKDFGWFVELGEENEKRIFADFHPSN